jgi:hypothetical protein
MGGTISFDAPARQQQAHNETKHQLLLFRQSVHVGNLSGQLYFGKPRAGL